MEQLYVFHEKHMNDLRTGAAIIKEFSQNETEKQEREDRAREQVKKEEESRVDKVKLSVPLSVSIAFQVHITQVKRAFLDDRKSQMRRVEREKMTRRVEP